MVLSTVSKIESRADRLANFAQRFQFPDRPRQLARSRFEFLEQPHVLDGDHGLVGEGFEQLDLRRGEGAHLDATRVQCSNEFSLLTKGNGQESAQDAAEPLSENRSARRTSGMWSVPCSRIQRYCGSSILISTRPMGMGPK